MAARKKSVSSEPHEKADKSHELLKKVRESKTVQLKPSRFIRSTFVALDNTEQEFKLRYYQVQGAYHLLVLRRMVLGDDTGLGKCVTGETTLVTDQGLIPLWQLCPEGELHPNTFHEPRIPVKVWTAAGEWAAVRRFFWSGVVPTRRVTTRHGYSIEGSLVHPVLVRDAETGAEAWVKLAELDPQRHWLCLDRSPNGFASEEPFIPLRGEDFATNTRRVWPSRLTPDLARLLGYVLGEAWTGSRQFLAITQHRDLNPEVHDDIRGLLRDVYGWSGNAHSQQRDITVGVSSVHIRAHLGACGIDAALAAKKRVPWVIERGTQASAREFLRGLLDCEGSVAKDGGFEFSSASKSLATGVQQLLLRFGVVARLRPKRVATRPNPYWIVQFFGDDARLFVDRIGLVSARKIAALNEVLERPSNPNQDVVPGMGEHFEAIHDRLGSIARFGNTVRGTFPHVVKGRRNPTYRFLFRLKGILEAEGAHDEVLEALLSKRFFYDPIATFEEREAPVMDIEVDHASHSFVGNGFVNHNTIEAISAFAHMLERNPKAKVIIVTPKSTVRQWAREIRRFTIGIRPIIIETATTTKDGVTPLQQRKARYRDWVKAPTGPDDERVVLIINYALLIRDWNAEGVVPVDAKGKPDPKQPVIPGVLDKVVLDACEDGGKLIAFLDEAQAFANMRTKTWEIVRFLSDRVDRAYALTATLLKSKLIEGFSIYKAIMPTLFKTKTRFLEEYCVTQLQKVPGSRRKIPIIVGYKNLDQFREHIAPYYLGRKKQDVSTELPVLLAKDILCELTPAEDAKYGQALSGILELGDGVIKDYEENKALVALIYCQQVVNSLSMLKYNEGAEIAGDIDFETLEAKALKVGTLGSKEQALVDLLGEEGELEGERVIVYTRFASLVARLQKILDGKKIKSVAITGAHSEKRRAAAQEAFQDLKSDVRVIFITGAGGMGINLQMARAMVFYELPWTWGDYVQLLGRMIRIGSPHKGVSTYHLMAERPSTKNGKTIDHHVYELLRKSKDIIDKVLGEAAVGALDFERGSSNIRELVNALKEGAV